MEQIGYKIGGSFEDEGYNGDSIDFEILFPSIYESREKAENCTNCVNAIIRKFEDGTVVIELYEDKKLVETINWNEWWKYQCCHVKGSKRKIGILDAHMDYEPYCAKFEDIFKNFVGANDSDVWSMQYLAYWIEPIIKIANDGSYTARKNK